MISQSLTQITVQYRRNEENVDEGAPGYIKVGSKRMAM